VLDSMDEDVDARERLFHNVVREYIVSRPYRSLQICKHSAFCFSLRIVTNGYG